MTVYVLVLDMAYNGQNVEAVFSSRALAEQYAFNKPLDTKQWKWVIEDYELDVQDK